MNIALSKPLFDDDEIGELRKVLESGWVMQGPKVEEFERAFARYVGSGWAVAVTSCSTALHLSMKAIGVGPGDEVIVPAFTWIATAAAVEECGARAVFCDIDLKTFNLDVGHVGQLITQRTKAIIAVNQFGLAADLIQLRQVAEKHDLVLIEDAACSLGATINGRQSGTFGRLGCFSFHPRKSITTGEGGMIVGNSHADELLLRSLRSHGVKMNGGTLTSPGMPFDLGDFDKLGYNYRLTDLQAAIGIAQMRKLEAIIQRRREIAAVYNSTLAELQLISLPKEPCGYRHTYQSYVILVGSNKSDCRYSEDLHEMRNQIMIDLKKAGIATRPGTHAVHTLEYFREKYGLSELAAPNAFAAMNRSIALPLHPTLTEREIDTIVTQVVEIHDSVIAVRDTISPRAIRDCLLQSSSGG